MTLPTDKFDYSTIRIPNGPYAYKESDGDIGNKKWYVIIVNENGDSKRIDCHNRQHAKNILKKINRGQLNIEKL